MDRLGHGGPVQRSNYGDSGTANKKAIVVNVDDIEFAEILCAVAPSKLPLPKPSAIWVPRACRKDSSHQITGISWPLVGREDRHFVVALGQSIGQSVRCVCHAAGFRTV